MLPRLGTAHRSLGGSPPEPMFPQGFQVPPRKSTCAPAHDTRGRRDSRNLALHDLLFYQGFSRFLHDVTECHMMLPPALRELLFSQGFSRFSPSCYLMLPHVTSTRDGASQRRGISSGTYVSQWFLHVPLRKSTCAPAHDTRGRRDSATPPYANCCFSKDFHGVCPHVT